MKLWLKENYSMVSWGLGGLVTLLALLVWGEFRSWDFSGLNTYSIFPILGILAFSLMWTHYILFAVRDWVEVDDDKGKYRPVSQKVVLAALLLHPGLIYFELWRNDLGFPPDSIEGYVGTSLVGFVSFGTIAWLAFILYEFKNKLHQKSWWRYVLAFNALAMVLIITHALRLGQHLQSGWYRSVWIVYAITLGLSYVYLLKRKKLF